MQPGRTSPMCSKVFPNELVQATQSLVDLIKKRNWAPKGRPVESMAAQTSPIGNFSSPTVVKMKMNTTVQVDVFTTMNMNMNRSVKNENEK